MAECQQSNVKAYIRSHRTPTKNEQIGLKNSQNGGPRKTSSGKNRQPLLPAKTKASAKREALSLAKRLEKITLIPDELLYKIFQYLPASDLLRCCCVSKAWREAANIDALWHKLFRQLPVSVQKISERASTCQEFNWKAECLWCVKERRSLMAEQLKWKTKKIKVKDTVDKFSIRWLLRIEDTDSKIIEISSNEHFFFRNSLSVRWNDCTSLPPVSKIKCISLFSQTPLFFSKDWKPAAHSVCTRSLLETINVKDFDLLKTKPLANDDQVSLYNLSNSIHVGLWNSSLPSPGDIAYCAVNLHSHNIVDKILLGTSSTAWVDEDHEAIFDDIDPGYGLHGFSASIEIRSNRNSFFVGDYREFEDGEIGDTILIGQYKPKDYLFYDIFRKISLTWKTCALKGDVRDAFVLDCILKDDQHEVMWDFSCLTHFEKICDDESNYNYENCEHWQAQVTDSEVGTFTLKVIRKISSDDLSIVGVEFRLQRSFFNNWFCTNY